MKNLHLVCNAHIDPVWLWDIEEGISAALSTFRMAADFCEKHGELVFNHNEVIGTRQIVPGAGHAGACGKAGLKCLEGLEPEGIYQVEGMEEKLHGSTLMKAGLETGLGGDFDSRMIRIKRMDG